MDVIGFLCVSLRSSTVQLHGSLGSRRALAYSEAGFSSQKGDRAWDVYKRTVAFCCAFLVGWRIQCKDIHKNISCLRWELSRKAVHNWVGKFSQGHSKLADDACPGRPVEIATEETVQWVEKLIRADRRIMIDSVPNALGCCHGLAYRIMHNCLFGKRAHSGCPENWRIEKKWTKWACLCSISCGMQMKEKICLTDSLLGTNQGCSTIKACFNAMETSQFTFSQNAWRLRICHQLPSYAYRVLGFLGSTVSPFSEIWC
jgi:hypothetical protein